jgi:hypothetical protein
MIFTNEERERAAALVLAGIRHILDARDANDFAPNVDRVVMVRAAIMSLDVNLELYHGIEDEASNRKQIAAVLGKKVWELT